LAAKSLALARAMTDAADTSEAQAETLRRLREMSAALTEQAYFRASGALRADDAENATLWMELFERLARGVRLTIALEARVARARDRAQHFVGTTPDLSGSRPAAERESAEDELVERDHESDDDGLPANATLDERIAYVGGLIEGAAEAFQPPRVRLVYPRRLPTWADVPASLLKPAGRKVPPPPPTSG
jgi:hypothetical protein